ncbi:hypothetical protein [Hymenobacter terricola]|uniref:hypothetical protein n=1 Tax=Hymenobacter terricola TaxID=2819236 RepID=UPI001B31726C|nr:hypothetical protein [Hymenobacter terricola]
MNAEREEIIIHGASAPKILYKYRNWENLYHRTILTDREVFLAPPSTFEDQLDCRNPIRYDILTDEQIIELYLHQSRAVNSEFTDAQHLEFAVRWAGLGLLRDSKYLEKYKRKDYAELNEQLGVLCLTANPENLELWHKYSRNSREFAVGFRMEVLFEFLGSAGPVVYVPQLPVIMPTPWHDMTYQMRAQLYVKTQKWAFEEEYRTLQFSGTGLSREERIVKLPSEAYEEVVFGHLSSPKKREKIAEAASASIPHIKFRLAHYDRGTRKIALVAL